MQWRDAAGNVVTDPATLAALGEPTQPGGATQPDAETQRQLNNPHPFPAANQQLGVPWWAWQPSQGALAGFGSNLRAAKEATFGSSGLPWGQAYDQAKTIYDIAGKQQLEEHPYAGPALQAAGAVPTLAAGGEVINGALRPLGAVGEFLAGDQVVPAGIRGAGGRMRALTEAERAAALNGPRNTAARVAQGVREGGQAGAYGAETNDEDPLQGAARGMLTGGAASTLVPALTYGGQQIANGLGVAAGYAQRMPSALQHTLGTLVGGGALLHGGAVLEHGTAALASALGAGGVYGLRYLNAHPQLRDLATRLGILGGGEASGAQPGTPAGLLAPALSDAAAPIR